MPKPKKNESKQDFLKRCTADVISEGNNSQKAYAMCNAFWDEEKKQRSALSLTTLPEFMNLKEDSKRREFLITAYTGKKVRSWFGGMIIDISGIQTKEKLPILREHQRDRVVGFGDAWRKENFYISGVFSESTEDAKEVLALADEGYPWQASISVRALKVEELKDEKTKAKVNGETVFGPLDIWRESKVGEVSFVSLGADDNTAAIPMSDNKFDVEIITSTGLEKKPVEKKLQEEFIMKDNDKPQEITLDFIKAEHPDIAVALVDEGKKLGAEEGAEAERNRIKAVSDQLMPGHEKLITALMWDGQTTGEQAAIKVLAEEKKTRAKMLDENTLESPEAMAQPSTDNDTSAAEDNLPFEDKVKAQWDKSQDLQAEFGGDYESFMAYKKAKNNGQVRVLSKK